MGDRASGIEGQHVRAPSPAKISSFRDLEVWQVARQLANEVYRVTGHFPQREWYGLATQMRRAAVSIISNIAEGFSRRTLPDYIHFLVTARSSAAELEAQILVASDQKYISEEDVELVSHLNTRVQRMLWKLEGALRQKQQG